MPLLERCYMPYAFRADAMSLRHDSDHHSSASPSPPVIFFFSFTDCLILPIDYIDFISFILLPEFIFAAADAMLLPRR